MSLKRLAIRLTLLSYGVISLAGQGLHLLVEHGGNDEQAVAIGACSRSQPARISVLTSMGPASTTLNTARFASFNRWGSYLPPRRQLRSNWACANFFCRLHGID